jgi:hypothetical protein
MNVELDVSALQAYLSQDQTIEMIAGLVHNALNNSELVSVDFELTELNPGTNPFTVVFADIQDIETNLHEQFSLHNITIPGVQKIPFDAPIQGVLDIHCDSNCQLAFDATVSYNQIAPGMIKYPISARISNLALHARLSVKFLGDALLLFFETAPEYRFELILQVGAEEKLIDEYQIRDFLVELLDKWIADNMLNGNAVKIPFGDTE